MLFCTFEASTIERKAIIHIYNTLTKTMTSTPNVISNWINKPCIWYTNNQHKTSHGGGKYSNKLRTGKILWHNEPNCKSGKHGQQHTLMIHKSWTKLPPTNTSTPDLKIQSRKFGISKSPHPRRRDQMFCVISCCRNHWDINDNDQYVLSYNRSNLCNNYISKKQGSPNQFSINFPRHYVLGHVLLDTNSLNEVDSWKEVVQPTKKPKNVDPRKSKAIQPLKKTTNNKK